jgi:hypothetical protein
MIDMNLFSGVYFFRINEYELVLCNNYMEDSIILINRLLNTDCANARMLIFSLEL